MIDNVSFKKDGKKYEIQMFECVYCDNNVVKVNHVDMSEVGQPYGRLHYNHVKYISGGRKEGILLCDACLGMSKKIKEYKTLERKKKTILKMLENLSEQMASAINEIKVDTTVVEDRIKNVRK